MNFYICYTFYRNFFTTLQMNFDFKKFKLFKTKLLENRIQNKKKVLFFIFMNDPFYNAESHSTTFQIFSKIDDHIHRKSIQLRNMTLFIEKTLYQKLPKARISKFQKVSSMREIPSQEQQPAVAKIEETIKETLVKAENTLEVIKNESVQKDEKKKIPINNAKSMNSNQKIGKTRMSSVENTRNRAKLQPISLKNIPENGKNMVKNANKPPILKTPLQNIEKHENPKKNEILTPEPIKILEKPESSKNQEKDNEKTTPNDFFQFRHENLQEKFNVQKENFQIYFEMRKKLNSTKKSYIETLSYFKEKSIKAQSRFLNKLENHYSEKKNALQQKYLKKDPSHINLTFALEDKATKNVNFMLYSLQNYVKILRYYLDGQKEIQEIAFLQENPENFAKKKLNEVFLLWVFTNFIQENVDLINKKIEDFFNSEYSRNLPKVREALLAIIGLEKFKKNEEKKKIIKNDEISYLMKINQTKPKGIDIVFEKKRINSNFKKGIEAKLWKINELVFQVFCNRVCLDIYMPKVIDMTDLLRNPKNSKKKELLQEKLRLFRMIYMVTMGEKRFPVFYLKD